MKLLLIIIAAVVLVGCGPSVPDISIHDASMEGNIDAIKRHLAAGTDPNLANLGERFLGDFIKPPLHFSENKEVAELLIAGGGETISAIDKFGVTKDISYISTGGGAFLEFVQGETLPAVQILDEMGA